MSLDRRVMNMAAHDAVEAARAGLASDGILETADIFDRIFHLLLEIGGQRPVGEAEARARTVLHSLAQFEGARIGPVAQTGEPAA